MIEQPSEAEQIRRLVGEICAVEDVNKLDVLYREAISLFGQRIRSVQHSWQDIHRLLDTKLRRPDPLFFRMLNEMVSLVYSQRSQLVHIIYECMPDLLIKFQSYLQLGVDQKENNNRLKGIDIVVLNIYNRQLPTYARYQQSLSVNELPHLTRIFGQVEIARQLFPQENEVTFSNKFRLKSFLLFLYYHNITQLSDSSINSFFRLVYVLCGGSTPEKFSLYMLNTPEDFSLFLHRISEEEFEWLLLSLYYIYVQKKHLKFEVIAAVNLIVRKCGNECKFKLTETGLSLLDLFENEYESVF